MIIERVADTACAVGEGPLWHSERRAVYWSDIPNGRLYRFVPDAEIFETVYEGRPVGGFTLQADGALLLFRDCGNVVVWRDGVEERVVLEHLPGLERTRFNDVCADPEGRVYCGTMTGPDVAGRLYRLDPDGAIHLLLDSLGTPNGMGFSPDLSRLYFNDTRPGRTWVFDYDRATGGLSNRRLFRDAAASGDPGRPDGLAMDAEGGVWTAQWDGAALLRFDAEGRLDRRIEMPARKITSLCFAGDAMDDLYATSAGGDKRNAADPAAGALFRLRGAGVRGMPRFRSRI